MEEAISTTEYEATLRITFRGEALDMIMHNGGSIRPHIEQVAKRLNIELDAQDEQVGIELTNVEVAAVLLRSQISKPPGREVTLGKELPPPKVVDPIHDETPVQPPPPPLGVMHRGMPLGMPHSHQSPNPGYPTAALPLPPAPQQETTKSAEEALAGGWNPPI